MVVLINCKNEEDPIKNECARVLTTLYIDLRRSMAANTVVGDGVWQKSISSKLFMVAIVTCKNDEDPSKYE